MPKRNRKASSKGQPIQGKSKEMEAFEGTLEEDDASFTLGAEPIRKKRKGVIPLEGEAWKSYQIRSHSEADRMGISSISVIDPKDLPPEVQEKLRALEETKMDEEENGGGDSGHGGEHLKREIDERTGKEEQSKKSKKKNKKKSKKSKKDVNVQEVGGIEGDAKAFSSRERKKKNQTAVIEDVYDHAEYSSWFHLGLDENLLRGIIALGFKEPTSIQSQSISSRGRDVIGASQTGTGKTLAFGIPIIQSIIQEKKKELSCGNPDGNKDGDKVEGVDAHVTDSRSRYFRALIVEPTRELAMQVCKHLEQVSAYCEDLKIVSIVGGIAIPKQDRLLRMRPDIVVATPGRLWYWMGERENTFLRDTSHFHHLVLDEADRMIADGHFLELEKSLELLYALQNENHKEMARIRRTYLYSATLLIPGRFSEGKKRSRPTPTAPSKKTKGNTPGSKDADEASQLEKFVEMIQFDSKRPPKIIDLCGKVSLAEGITHARIDSTLEDKDLHLLYFLRKYKGKTLVFVNSVTSAHRLVRILPELGVEVFRLHGTMQQRQRLKHLDRFDKSTSVCSVLVATDVAARGLDIPMVDHVVHYHIARSPETYVHRSGRTGRAGAEGFVLSLVGPEEQYRYKLICEALGEVSIKPFPEETGLLVRLKDQVSIVHRIEKRSRVTQRVRKERSWMERKAKDMGVDFLDAYDEDRWVDPETGEDKISFENRHMKVIDKEVKILRSSLTKLIEEDKKAEESEDKMHKMHKGRGISRRFVTLHPSLRPTLDGGIDDSDDKAMVKMSASEEKPSAIQEMKQSGAKKSKVSALKKKRRRN
eukprot:TRINITY_DN21567_c1_g1_i1.p1 TRINITY_DN21567_c1_g1~~TRINITY_DN21567_c1_g1_i1.p1  ORF type:complete len:817 (+),score=278.48 TRINITY_DN21567_c1_g1_i1:80-2530(+)